MREIILASASTRRARILEDCGIKHRVVLSGAIEEIDEGKNIKEIVKLNAEKKADLVSKKNPEAVVISCDTLVAHAEDILGKPSGELEAKKMLMRFQGKDIEVYTGTCVVCGSKNKKAIACDMSEIQVASLTEKEVDEYFSLLGPYDKAGGFSIEGVGSILFDDIKGSYFNILGLSMMRLRGLFAEIDENILNYITK